MFDVVALGELLIDFTQNGCSSQGNGLFEANPGGAPGNVLAMLGRLGHRTAFIGKVGEDCFGHLLADTLNEEGIDTSGLLFDRDVPTTLAMVHTLSDGDREFSFYRNPGADMKLRAEEVKEELFWGTRIFHFGSLSMTAEPARGATMRALELAGKNGCLISFDPNLREPLWSSPEEARAQIMEGISWCRILKISDNEIQWLTGENNYDEGVRWIRERFDIPLILVTMGKEGSRAYYGEITAEAGPFLTEETVETTGAGDAFCGCVLSYVLNHGLANLREENLKDMLLFANGAASRITTRKGALKVMPTREEVERLLERARTCGDRQEEV